MLVSLNWLKEFVEIDRSAEEIADLLTMGGIEVESVSHVGHELETGIYRQDRRNKASSEVRKTQLWRASV